MHECLHNQLPDEVSDHKINNCLPIRLPTNLGRKHLRTNGTLFWGPHARQHTLAAMLLSKGASSRGHTPHLSVSSRHRWVNSVDTVAAFTLLACTHALLPRAFALWLLALDTGREPKDLALPHLAGDMDGECPDPVPLPVAAEEGEGAWWAQWNKTQRRKAKQWLLQEPTGTLVVATVSLELSAHVLHVIERVASEDFMQQQQWEKLQGQRASFRVTALCNDRLATPVFRMAADILDDAHKFAAMPALHKTWRAQGLGFVLVSCSVAALEHYLFKQWRGFPFCIFELLSTDPPRETLAQAILDKPACLRDSWSKRFLERFSTVASLVSRQCQALLYAMGCALKLEITSLECRHASLRKLQRNRSATHVAEVADVSAEFLLHCFRRLESLFAAPKQMPNRAKAPQRGKVKKQKKKVGGGAQRCCISDVLREQHGLPKEIRLKQREMYVLGNQRFREAKADGGEAWRDLQSRGRKMQEVRRAGVMPHRKKRPMSAQTGGVLKRSRSLLLPKVPSQVKSAADVVHHANLEAASCSAEEAVSSSWKAARCEEEVAKHSMKKEVACPDIPRFQNPMGLAEKLLDLKVETFLPPVQASIRALMASSPANRKMSIHSQLQHFWCLKHIPIKHSGCPKPRSHSKLPSLGVASLCSKVGFCTCHQPRRNAFANVMSGFLRKLWVKHSRTRALMDCRRGVLSLQSSEGKWYWHIAYCNRKCAAFIMVELQEADTQNVLRECLPSNAVLLTRSLGGEFLICS